MVSVLPCVSVKAASDMTFTVVCVICYSVEIGGHKAGVGFGVLSKPAIKMIINTAFIDSKNDKIKTKDRQLITYSEHAIDIVKGLKKEDTVQFLDRNTKRPVRTVKLSPAVRWVEN